MKSNARMLGEFLEEHPDLVHSDPETCGGQVILRGTRLSLKTVLECFETGATVKEVCEWYPAPTVTPTILKRIKEIWDEKRLAVHH